jgi:hypothetical protein
MDQAVESQYRRPFKVRISTLTPARPQLLNVTKRKDRAAELRQLQNQKATLLQSQWRSKKTKTDYSLLKSQPPKEVWRGTVEIGNLKRVHAVVIRESFLAGKSKGLVVFTATEKLAPGKFGPPLTLSLIRSGARPLLGVDGERSARQLGINELGNLYLDKNKADQFEMGDEVKAEDMVDNNEEMRLESYRQVPFASLNRVQFCVDGAVGLPINCTASRVSGQLLLPNRQRIGPMLSSYSDPDSAACCPKFDLFMTWRASDIVASTLTILCRVDTMERPSLKTVALGYAALKLCVDENGIQPFPTATSNDREPSGSPIYLNAGKFMIPINVGSVPEWGVLNEELIESLPPLPGAYLCVRLFEGSYDSPSKFAIPPPNSESEAGINGGSGGRDAGSVALSLYGTKVVDSRGAESRQPLPLINAAVGKDFVVGKNLSREDYKQLTIMLSEWIHATFQPYDEVTDTINRYFLLRYDDDIGIVAGVDGLHNMPRAYNLPPRSIVGYKVGFRYLRADGKPFTWPEGLGDNPDHIIDDMSLQWDYSLSTESCPVFADPMRHDIRLVCF